MYGDIDRGGAERWTVCQPLQQQQRISRTRFSDGSRLSNERRVYGNCVFGEYNAICNDHMQHRQRIDGLYAATERSRPDSDNQRGKRFIRQRGGERDDHTDSYAVVQWRRRCNCKRGIGGRNRLLAFRDDIARDVESWAEHEPHTAIQSLHRWVGYGSTDDYEQFFLKSHDCDRPQWLGGVSSSRTELERASKLQRSDHRIQRVSCANGHGFVSTRQRFDGYSDGVYRQFCSKQSNIRLRCEERGFDKRGERAVKCHNRQYSLNINRNYGRQAGAPISCKI
jgi:hypothetical protein